MKRSEAVKHGAIAFTGYLLSPLSWWNDLYVNIPLAYVLAIPFALLNKNWFATAFLAAYWLTNLAGLVLLHWSARSVRGRTTKTRVQVAADMAVAVIYTTVMIVLLRYGYLKPPTEYIDMLGISRNTFWT